MKKNILTCLAVVFISLGVNSLFAQVTAIPLAEHPRPDFQRDDWTNLNGKWAFAFDSLDLGIKEGWEQGKKSFPDEIMVPFPWGAELSGLEDLADIGWYQREVTVNEKMKGKRVFLTIGASDWETTVWLDGQLLGKHQGGYVPFSFELTDKVRFGESQKLIIRVDDARRDFTLYGKQGYGNARGIWQTIYLEARGQNYLDALHFTPDIDNEKVIVTAYLPKDAGKDLSLNVKIKTPNGEIAKGITIPKGAHKINMEMAIPDPNLWNLETPYLYDAEATLEDDKVTSYFGMRKISVVDMPGTDIPYIALNNEPIYLQLALDQSYHPEGFYTFPSDQFMREEIERSKSIGLNGIRTHIKVEVPRKLYWADRLGLLVMEDLPNSWGEPDYKMQAESEYTLREMIKRDYNHPAIFSWIIFNETWGLRTKVQDEDGKDHNAYLPETQDWVASMYYLAKSLDQTRLVEDNSICCGAGHTETDINSWHAYLPGWEWDNYLKNLTENTYEGSTFDFEDGFKQGRQPNINSECGNVWGYEGSTGDVDWSWDYHRMMNTFRTYPKVAGWLYTEHHDVINEWNGYWRFDRTVKETGMSEIVKGMDINDLHSPLYLSTGNEICRTVKGGEQVEVPLFISSMNGEGYGGSLIINYEMSHINYLGEDVAGPSGNISINFKPWMQSALDPLKIKMPNVAGLATLKLKVTDAMGVVLHRNFMHYEIKGGQVIPKMQVVSVQPQDFSKAEWSLKQWDVREGRKVNGAGKGFFEYIFDVSGAEELAKSKSAYFLIELSAKELFAKDQEEGFEGGQDYMKGAKVASSRNPNAYPMTDEKMFPSEVTITVNGEKIQTVMLADDPADHRGVLSWHHQLQDRKLREAGSYGYLVKVPISKKMLKAAAEKGQVVVNISANGKGGVAVYGKEFGRYPWDPSLVLKK